MRKVLDASCYLDRRASNGGALHSQEPGRLHMVSRSVEREVTVTVEGPALQFKANADGGVDLESAEVVEGFGVLEVTDRVDLSTREGIDAALSRGCRVSNADGGLRCANVGCPRSCRGPVLIVWPDTVLSEYPFVGYCSC